MPLDFPLSTSLKVKKFGYTPGTAATPDIIPSSAPFKALAVATFSPGVTINNVEQLALGLPTIYNIAKVGERYRAPINWNPFNRELLEYAINMEGTNNRDIPIHFGMSQMLNEAGVLTEKYMFLKGATCDSITIAGTNDAVNVSSDWVALDFTQPSITHGQAGTPTWETLNRATMVPWTGLSGGVDPVVWNALATKVKAYSVTVNNAVDDTNQFIGDDKLSAAPATTHRVTLSLDLVYKNNDITADVRTLTLRDSSIKLATNAYLKLTGVALEAYDWETDASSTSATVISYSGKALKAEVVASLV